jgi:hypothetical protein
MRQALSDLAMHSACYLGDSSTLRSTASGLHACENPGQMCAGCCKQQKRVGILTNTAMTVRPDASTCKSSGELKVWLSQLSGSLFRPHWVGAKDVLKVQILGHACLSVQLYLN